VSYDLYFNRPDISRGAFHTYFNGRPRFQMKGDQAWYENEKTSVYFYFEWLQDDAVQTGSEERVEEEVGPENDAFAFFNLNYYRPHFFGLEAEPEVRAFVEHFSCAIYDPQTAGMGDGAYSRSGFLAGWNQGNRFAYSAILGSENSPEAVHTKPTQELEAIWTWNSSIDEIYDQLQLDIFVPRIFYALVEGKLCSVALWPDGIPTLVPEVDFVYVGRQKLSLGGPNQPKDYCLVVQRDLDGVLSDLEDGFPLRARNPRHETTPANVEAFVRKLQSFQGSIQRIGLDSVLNAEWAAEALGKRKPVSQPIVSDDGLVEGTQNRAGSDEER
jgi:hypothetical protein